MEDADGRWGWRMDRMTGAGKSMKTERDAIIWFGSQIGMQWVF
jgi:hypothetical protein